MRIQSLIVACLLAASFANQLQAQSNVAILTLEQSTGGLTNWQRVPLTADKLTNNGDMWIEMPPATNGFYRLRIQRPPEAPPAPAISLSPNTYSNNWTIFGFNPNNNWDFFSVTISNAGRSDLVVSGVTHLNVTSLFKYYLNNAPLTIPAGQSTSAIVLINTAGFGFSGSVSDQIAITSNAESGNSTIAIQGSYWVDQAGGGTGP